MRDGFTLNGQHCSVLGVIMESKTLPILTKPKDVYIDIPGRDGSYLFSGALSDAVIPIVCGIKTANAIALMAAKRQIAAWVFSKQKVLLVFDDEPDKFYLVKYDGEIGLEKLTVQGMGKFTLIFRCSPLAYMAETHDHFVNNLVTNGNFAQGLTGWAVDVGTADVSNGELTCVASGDGGFISQARVGDNVLDKTYVRCYYRLISYISGNIFLQANSDVIVLTPLSYTWQKISAVLTQVSGVAQNFIGALSGTMTVKFKEYLAINLTDTFGVGNEPDLATCDMLYADYFDGTEVSVNNTGNAETPPVFTFTFTATATEMKVTLGAKYIRVVHNFAIADVLIVNCETGLVSINGIRAMEELDWVASELFMLAPGNNVLTILPEDKCTAIVTYSPRWL